MKLILFILSIFILSSLSFAQEKIRMGYIEFYPIFYTDKNGHPAGDYIDLMKNLSKKINYKMEFVTLPTKRMGKDLVNGRIDLWVGLKSLPEFRGTTYIGTIPISKIKLMAYWLDTKFHIESDKANEILKALKNKRIVTIRGYSYGGIVDFLNAPENKIFQLQVEDHRAALSLLKSGRVDYILDYESPIERANLEIRVPYLKSVTINSFDAFFVVSKKNKNGQQMLSKLEKAYKEYLNSIKK